MASLITPQFEHYIAEQTIANGTVVFDEFIFANIPGLNANNLAQHLTMPAAAQIVHRQAISQKGVINENAVVYSVTIGTDVGDFDFNFIGLINKSKNLLAVAVQTAPVKKTRNKNAIQGNSITRNILLEFSGAKSLTGINVSAETWQIDFTVRLHGLDEKIRLTNRDLYGRAVFFDDGFLVKRKTGNQFTIQSGLGYVEGVRMNLNAIHHLTANNLPCSIYADVVHHCTVTGAYETEIKYLTQSKADYIDTANRQHYVQILADIDSQGNVTDRRLLSPFLGITPKDLDDTTINKADKTGHTHKLPIASLVKRGIAKLYSGYDSDSEEMAATPKAIKGLKALIDAVTKNLGNYIPNSKKSSSVGSNSAETVATSAAVKTAFDKGVTALNTANNANNNANGRVSKSGDTMTGTLTVPHIIVNDAGNNNSVQVGDDAKFLDVDIGNTIGLQGIGAPTRGYIAYGTSKKRFGFDGTLFRAESAIGTNHYGHGSYSSQYSTNAPFVVEANGSVSRDTYHPFIKGKVRAAGQYGTAFSLGYTTKQGSGDGFGRGIIHLIEDNGAEKHWDFEHNGDFRSSNDVITGSGNSLNTLQNNYTQFVGSNSYIKSLTNNNIQLRWKPSGNGLELKIDNTELGGIHYSNRAYVEATAGNYGGLWIDRPTNNDRMLFESNGNRFAFIRRNRQSGSNHYVIFTPEKNGTVALLEDFTQSLSGNGWCKLPSGLIIQWGQSTSGNISFPIAFPTTCFVVSHSKTGGGRDTRVANISRTGFSSYATGDVGTTFYMAIGR
ncbi:phage tail protein [Rodentibacter myodis]|uniref:phage tail-collar fiber domain-containing protein n=1 Tax=Rodentibacter myodis TaxID=1907939 RepID=UPI001FC90644|nr:phage tail protein [Rodentibacter myodis]